MLYSFVNQNIKSVLHLPKQKLYTPKNLEYMQVHRRTVLCDKKTQLNVTNLKVRIFF